MIAPTKTPPGLVWWQHASPARVRNISDRSVMVARVLREDLVRVQIPAVRQTKQNASEIVHFVLTRLQLPYGKNSCIVL